ncbi:MAG: HAD-IA family hydrolase [Anaerolineae bacterium]|nr:HAD-IA family hydrolase [Anaerolineae bacterium]
MGTLDAVFWDAGGTLFDTYPAVVSAAQTALAGFGADVPEARLMGLFRQSTGYALETLAEALTLSREGLTTRFEEAYEAVAPEVQQPFPFAVEVCRYVRDCGRRNFIVTHRGRASLMGLLEAHAMMSLFADCITKEDPYPRKPDPASTMALMTRYGLAPERCLVVGDRKLDILAGTRAGAITCLYGDEEAAAPLADLHIQSYNELLRWLDAARLCTDPHQV